MKNSGFTMVELIVVITIMAILLASGLKVVGVNDNIKANRCAEIADSSLNKSMVETMGKGNVAGIIYFEENSKFYAAIIRSDCDSDGDGVYELADENIAELISLAAKPITMQFIFEGCNGETIEPVLLENEEDRMNMTSAVQILFKRSTGAIKKSKIDGVECYVTGIQIHCVNKSKNIAVYPATGRHEIM